MQSICLKAMAKEPARRYATARDLADDLRRFLNGEPIHARPVGRLERGWRWARRRPAVAGLLATLVCVIAASLAGLTALWLQAEEGRKQAEDARAEEAKAKVTGQENYQAAQDNYQEARLNSYVPNIHLA